VYLHAAAGDVDLHPLAPIHRRLDAVVLQLRARGRIRLRLRLRLLLLLLGRLSCVLGSGAVDLLRGEPGGVRCSSGGRGV